jgi:hypothetical protein
MLSSSKKKRPGVLITPSHSALDRRHLFFPSTPDTPLPSLPVVRSDTNICLPATDFIDHIFIFSPFGLCCTRPECHTKPQIEPSERAIQIHLKKHALSIHDYNMIKVRQVLASFRKEVDNAKAAGNMDLYCSSDTREYKCFICVCGEKFHTRKANAIRHCKKIGCDATKLQTKSVIKLCCGRYVTNDQVDAFFCEPIHCDTRHLNFQMARDVLEPLLPEMEKRDHTYTHMFYPLISKCKNEGNSFNVTVSCQR